MSVYVERLHAPLTEFMRTFALYREHGTLPHAGGLMDQPATWVEATSLLDGFLSAARRRREHEQQEIRARASRG